MNKLKIFDSSKYLKILKIVALSFAGLLLLWFTFDITGLKFGNIKIVTSAFVDEPIDFVFYIVFIASIVCFILKDKIGKYVLSAFLLLWGVFQFTAYFKSGDSINGALNSFFILRYLIKRLYPRNGISGSNRTHGYGWRLS